MCLSFLSKGQTSYKDYLKDFNLHNNLKKQLKFSTIYGSINGGTSLSDVKTYSVTSGNLEEGVVQTPYDYSFTIGIRKIARFGY